MSSAASTVTLASWLSVIVVVVVFTMAAILGDWPIDVVDLHGHCAVGHCAVALITMAVVWTGNRAAGPCCRGHRQGTVATTVVRLSVNSRGAFCEQSWRPLSRLSGTVLATVGRLSVDILATVVATDSGPSWQLSEDRRGDRQGTGELNELCCRYVRRLAAAGSKQRGAAARLGDGGAELRVDDQVEDEVERKVGRLQRIGHDDRHAKSLSVV